MAMFMLQQACELSYRSLLHVLRGKAVKSHSPTLLRKHLKRFAPEIIGVFSPVEEDELHYLQLLEEAYVSSRYHAHYHITSAIIAHLNERIGLLQQKAVQLFKLKMEVLAQKMEELSVN